MGRKPALNETQKAEALKMRQEGKTLKEIASHFLVSVVTIGKILKQNLTVSDVSVRVPVNVEPSLNGEKLNGENNE